LIKNINKLINKKIIKASIPVILNLALALEVRSFASWIFEV
jgi:hypothetical protein